MGQTLNTESVTQRTSFLGFIWFIGVGEFTKKYLLKKKRVMCSYNKRERTGRTRMVDKPANENIWSS